MQTFKQFLQELEIKTDTKKEVPQETLDLIQDAIPKMMNALKLGGHSVRCDIDNIMTMANAQATGGARNGKAYLTLSEKFVKKASKAELLQTIAHELIHAWQDITGLMNSDDDDEWIFDGKKYKPTRPWKKCPWEWQAVLNAWPLVVKAGLADGLTKPSLYGDHQTARIQGRQAGLEIPFLA